MWNCVKHRQSVHMLSAKNKSATEKPRSFSISGFGVQLGRGGIVVGYVGPSALVSRFSHALPKTRTEERAVRQHPRTPTISTIPYCLSACRNATRELGRLRVKITRETHTSGYQFTKRKLDSPLRASLSPQSARGNPPRQTPLSP